MYQNHKKNEQKTVTDATKQGRTKTNVLQPCNAFDLTQDDSVNHYIIVHIPDPK